LPRRPPESSSAVIAGREFDGAAEAQTAHRPAAKNALVIYEQSGSPQIGLIPGHVYEFDLGALPARDKDELLHRNAYYTVNEIPKAK